MNEEEQAQAEFALAVEACEAAEALADEATGKAHAAWRAMMAAERRLRALTEE
ncbi:MAG: hypothetical protein ACRCSN_19815 [Dermatophilaceae bacterium]